MCICYHDVYLIQQFISVVGGMAGESSVNHRGSLIVKNNIYAGFLLNDLKVRRGWNFK